MEKRFPPLFYLLFYHFQVGDSSVLTNNLQQVVVDDDPGAIRRLKSLLQNVDDIEYVNGFTSAPEALDFLKKEKVDLIFLDVEMPEYNGLWLAKQVRDKHVEIVFMTAHSGYAAQAFEVCALDYLMKPINKDGLGILLEKVRYKQLQEPPPQEEQIESFYRYLDPTLRPTRIFINMVSKIMVLKLDEVCYFSSNDNYTTVIMRNNDRHISSKPIRTYEESLKHDLNFVRISRYSLINKDQIVSIERNIKSRKITVLMTNGDTLDTGYKTKEEILAVLHG